jgi:hypothetical protein
MTPRPLPFNFFFMAPFGFGFGFGLQSVEITCARSMLILASSSGMVSQVAFSAITEGL